MVTNHADMDLYLAKLIKCEDLKDPFYILHLGMLDQVYRQWKESMPRVVLHYAIKCNSSPVLLTMLAKLGACFDCASKEEVMQVIDLGISSEKVVFANTVKPAHHVAYAAQKGVHVYTFDHVSELHKIKAIDPNAQLILRISVKDEGSAVRMSDKFGARPNEVLDILVEAKDHNVPIIGVAFHIGSGATIGDNFREAIALSREVFDKALKLGFPPMKVLDIGGGFSSHNKHLSFLEAAAFINKALEVHFPEQMGVKIIAEPGRYIAESVLTLATPIFGKKKRINVIEYWLADGLHGGLNITDLGLSSPRPWHILAAASLPKNLNCCGKSQIQSIVFGPTCDSTDIVLQNVALPELEVGDWLLWPNIGAYAQVMSSSFNGFGPHAYHPTYLFGNLPNVS